MPGILVVDDDASLQMELEESLLSLNYEVAGIADSGEDAVRMAAALNPDVILMDIMMPGGMDGIAAATEIKETSDAAIVFVTGFGEPEYIDRAKSLEPSGYVMKPFGDAEIQAAIEIALHRRAVEKKAKQAHEALRETNRRLEKEVSKRKTAEEEKDRAIATLQKTIRKIDTLKGLLPICAACKRIRDKKGEWRPLESYISEHSNADFTHDICPDCAERLYPDIDTSRIS
jgi:DNA-binding NarL/FixJ family response regulator